MTYYHWAPDPVRLRQITYPQSGHPKPNGLWFDANEDWKRWCEATEFRLDALRYRHTVTILDPSRILFLDSEQELDEFTRQYERNRFGSIQLLQRPDELNEFTRQYGRDLVGDILGHFSKYVAWTEVAEKHSGIVIVPFSRDRSERYLWYYGWHCASGCVWDTSVVRLGRPWQKATGNRPG